MGVGKVVIPLEKDVDIFIWVQKDADNASGTLLATNVKLIQKVSSDDDWIPDSGSTAEITKISSGKISLTADGYQKIYLNKISEILKDYSLIELKVSGNVGNIWFGNDVWGGENPNAKMSFIPAGGGETTVSLKDMIKEGEPFFIIMPEGDETEVIITYSFISTSGVGTLIPITNNSEGRGTLKENVEDGYIILNWAISSHNQDMVITAKSVEELLKKGYNKLSFNLEFSGEMTRMIIRRSTGDYALLEGASCSIHLQSGVSYYIWVQNVDTPSTGTVKIKDIKYESMEWIPDGNRPAQYTQVEPGKIKFSATDHEQKIYYGFIDIKAKEYDLVEIHVSGNQNHIWIGNDVWVGESVYMSSIAPGGGEIILELSKLVRDGSGKLVIMSHGEDETGGENNVEIQYTFYKSGGGPFNLIVNNGANLKVSDTEMKITFTSVSNENTVYISTEEVASLINSGVKSITFTLSTPTDDAARIIIMERINTQYPLVYTGTTTEYTLQLVQGQSYALFIQNSQAYNIKGVLEITNIVLNRDSIE